MSVAPLDFRSLFALIESLDESKWSTSANLPPRNKKDLGYDSFNIVETIQEDDYIKYLMLSSTGDCHAGLLYGSKGDPLRGVPTCWISFGKGKIIKGIILANDWVEMTQDYLKILEGNVVESTEPLDEGLYHDLQMNKWTNKGYPPAGKMKLGYTEYTVLDVDFVNESELNVHLAKHCNHTGQCNEQVTVKMIHVLRNCFRSTPKCYLKLNKGLIVGIMTKDKWIVINASTRKY